MGDNFNIYEGKPQVSIPDQVRTLVTESNKVFSEIDFEPGQNALEEMLELGNEPGASSSAVHVLSECPAKTAIKIEALVCPGKLVFIPLCLWLLRLENHYFFYSFIAIFWH